MRSLDACLFIGLRSVVYRPGATADSGTTERPDDFDSKSRTVGFAEAENTEARVRRVILKSDASDLNAPPRVLANEAAATLRARLRTCPGVKLDSSQN